MRKGQPSWTASYSYMSWTDQMTQSEFHVREMQTILPALHSKAQASLGSKNASASQLTGLLTLASSLAWIVLALALWPVAA